MDQAGYFDNLTSFAKADKSSILTHLKSYVHDAGESQIRAWSDSIKLLQTIVNDLIDVNDPKDDKRSIILEYTIPLESRRIDAVQLLNGVIVVFEFKGKTEPTQADIDQAAAYARDLRAYHKLCTDGNIRCILLLMRGSGEIKCYSDVEIMGSDSILKYLKKENQNNLPAIEVNKFLEFDSYQPLPTLIKAARELFQSGTLKRIHRAAMATEPTLLKCAYIIHETVRRKRRALILISGVPGAGKTLVGLQLAHSKYLDDLSVARANGEKPTAPAVFLSGNGPLVEVLQYELRSAGGDGKTFVRGVFDYVRTFTKKANLIPPQHVLIYDEAQRAFDAEQVEAKHPDMPKEFQGLSEPELFIQFAERVPDWCVVVGLIGSGQEIHIGEEAGIVQWKDAIKKAKLSADWDVYIPDNDEIKKDFIGLPSLRCENTLELSITIRFHLATRLYDFVKYLLEGKDEEAKTVAIVLEKNGYSLRITQDLQKAKDYLVNRYNNNPDARFGVVASAKDKDLSKHGIPKGFKSPGEVGPGKFGKWYSEPFGKQGSCANLDTVVTEFGAQGLELDSCLIAWGTDFIRKNNSWNNDGASGYRDKNRIRSAKHLRENAYRVLLTRGRDGCVVFVPKIYGITEETYSFLLSCGFTELI